MLSLPQERKPEETPRLAVIRIPSRRVCEHGNGFLVLPGARQGLADLDDDILGIGRLRSTLAKRAERVIGPPEKNERLASGQREHGVAPTAQKFFVKDL